jgi:two-component system, chemotaxis family, sensor kinase CheA
VDDLTREFLLESQEGLDRMERCLTLLETQPSDTALLADIFRAVHTIKGATGFLGFARLEILSHAGENLLVLLREGKLIATPEIISGLLSLMDRLRSILRVIDETGKEGDVQLEDRNTIQLLETFQHSSPATQELEESVAVGAPGTAVRKKRSAGGRRGGSAPRRPRSASKGDTGSTAASEDPPRKEGPPASPAGAPAMLEPAGKTSLPNSTDVQFSGSSTDSTLRVDVELLNRMMNLVGELVLTRNQILATNTDAGFALLGRRLDMVTTDLREAVMKARMQPVSHVFSRFPRLVRDLALGMRKRVRLEMDGQDTELDKSLLEAIRDPLTHSIRNSLDHGIEMPEARIANGKPPEGLVRLRAYQEGGHVVVEVQDDGAGINIDRIRAKAIERQLLPQGKAELMDDREILQLIFVPGFSTASSVTNVSGRGVGMDVVRTNVEKIGGKVELESQPGNGTIVRLRIPLTLAIVPALIVHSSNQNFAVPQTTLTELVHLAAGESDQRIEWLENAALYRLRGMLLPLVFLDELLQNSARQKNAPRDIAILNTDGFRFGLVVDGLADPEEIVVKPLAGVLRDIGFYSGATILGNGEMALILNPSAIAKHAGIKFTVEEEKQDAGLDSTDVQDFLLVESQGRRAALPLETVVRIERIPRSRVEQIGSRSVLRIDGKLLPLDDASSNFAPGQYAEDAPTTIVVCRDGERHVGVTVSQVLDVTGGQQLEEAGSHAIADGVTLLQERVTEIIPLSRIPRIDSANLHQFAIEDAENNPSVGPAQLEAKEVCSVRVGDTLFGVPITHLLEILDKPATQPVPLAPHFIGGLVHYRGEVLTSISIRKLLGMGPAQDPEHVLVLESPYGPFGLFVDEVGEIFQVTDADHEPNPSTLETKRQAIFAGEWKLTDRLLVSLEPERLDPIRLARTFQG